METVIPGYRKVTVSAITGILTAALMWAFDKGGFEVNAEVIGYIVAAVMAVTFYFVPERFHTIIDDDTKGE